jgi:hypothetical protein
MGNCIGKKGRSDETRPNEKAEKESAPTPVRKLTEKELGVLLSNTNYNKAEIVEWHTGFIVKMITSHLIS